MRLPVVLAAAVALGTLAQRGDARKAVIVTLGADEEAKLGDALAARMARDPGFSSDAELVARVERAASELAPPAPWPWKVHVVKGALASSAAAPGGHVVLSEALVRACEDDAELRAVLAHEMAHALRRDVTRLMVAGYGEDALRAMARGEADAILGGAAANVAAAGSLARHGEVAELAADADAVSLADGAAAPLRALLARLGARKGDVPWAEGLRWRTVGWRYLRAHPSSRARAAGLDDLAKP